MQGINFNARGKRDLVMTAKLASQSPDSFEPLTEVQERTLKAVKKLRDVNGSFPTYEELADELCIKPASAYDAISLLVKKGYLRRREARKSRSLEIVFYPFDEKVSQGENTG